MEFPKLTAQHRRLEELAGKWTGQEKVYASPYTAEGQATGRFDFRMDLEGFFLLTDYVEESDSNPTYYAHGVFGWDVKQACYTLHWFDNFGNPPAAPGHGQWQGDTLTFHHEYPTGSGRTIFGLGDSELKLRVEMSPDGKSWKPLIEGSYHRL
jgi:hypothetical protein